MAKRHHEKEVELVEDDCQGKSKNMRKRVVAKQELKRPQHKSKTAKGKRAIKKVIVK